MTQEQKIKMVLAYCGATQADLAAGLKTTPQNLNQKIKKGTLTNEDMDNIAAVLGVRWRAEFVLPDGRTI